MIAPAGSWRTTRFSNNQTPIQRSPHSELPTPLSCPYLRNMPADPPHRRTLKRFDTPGQVRFITFSCFQRRPFLRSDRARQWLADAIIRARDIHHFHLWAYVFMPTHAHLLIYPPKACPRVGPALASIKLSIARHAINWTRAHAPDKLFLMEDPDSKDKITYRFWQRGAGYDRNLWTPKRIWKAIDYIHLNPVEAELSTSEYGWHWSSATDFARLGTGPISLDHEVLPSRAP